MRVLTEVDDTLVKCARFRVSCIRTNCLHVMVHKRTNGCNIGYCSFKEVKDAYCSTDHQSREVMNEPICK